MSWIITMLLMAALLACGPSANQPAAPAAPRPAMPAGLFADYDVVDLTVTISENLPAHWGASPPFQRWTYNWFAQRKDQYGTAYMGSEGPYYGQRYILDEHTGTQSDYPAHFLPPADSGLPEAGPMGNLTGDKYPLERMMGPAVVIDVTDLRDKGENGKSAPIPLARIQGWEKQHGEIRAGDVVLFRSGYSDAYYKPMPEGLRLTFDVIVTRTKPGWPAPTVEAMEYLQKKGVWHLGTDGPSMGPAEGGQAVHVAGLRHGMSWEELLTRLDQLPPRGAFYVALGTKVINQSGSNTRAIAFVPGKK